MILEVIHHRLLDEIPKLKNCFKHEVCRSTCFYTMPEQGSVIELIYKSKKQLIKIRLYDATIIITEIGPYPALENQTQTVDIADPNSIDHIIARIKRLLAV